MISAGVDGDVFEPRHSTKGFQYVRVEGDLGRPHRRRHHRGRRPHRPAADRRLRSAPTSGSTRLHRICDWSFRGNACDLPTDCPTRERAGWTGDWQIFVETAAFLYDVSGFNRKWLRDLAAEQRPDGRVTNLVPESHPGDDRPPEFWPAHRRLVGLGRRRRPRPLGATPHDRRHRTSSPSSTSRPSGGSTTPPAPRRPDGTPPGVERSAEPLPHERYLWDSGWHYGEWLEGGETLDEAIAAALVADPGPVATAYLHRSAARARPTSPAILGHDGDADRYAELAANVADAWRTEFLADDGTTTPDTQATYARALAFGLIPDELRRRRRRPPRRSSSATPDDHLSTGFLATPFLLPVLADTGHLDVAYDLLFQDTEPSWLVMVDRGATTVWEEWGGVDADGDPHASLNHYSKGAVISFLHQYVAGLQLLEPGYRRFRVAPQPGRRHHQRPRPPRLARTAASRSPGSIDDDRGRLGADRSGRDRSRRRAPRRHRSGSRGRGSRADLATGRRSGLEPCQFSAIRTWDRAALAQASGLELALRARHGCWLRVASCPESSAG